MDDNARRRRQQNETPYTTSDPRLSTENQGRGFSGTGPERYRPSSVNTSPPTSRGVPPGTASYPGYYQVSSPSFPTALQYQSTAAVSGYSQDQRQQPQTAFATYNPDIMYNVSQQSPQASAYSSASQFQTRQPTMQLLPDVTAPYFSGEPTSTPEASGMQHQTTSSSASTVYPPPPQPSQQQQQQQQQQQHQSPGGRAPLLQQNYPTMAIGGMSQSTEVMEEEQFPPPGPGMEAAYTTYQTALKEIFQNIIQGRLGEASQSLLEVSEWLLGHVGDLGLTVDEVTLHGDRIKLWGEFNSAWLGIFQKQKDFLESGMRVVPPQSLMTQEFINKMAKHLIRMCDIVEKYGLVDYQYGVAEEQIMTILMECLDLQESLEKIDDSSAAVVQSSDISRAPS